MGKTILKKIYSIRLWQITLRELFVLQSLYYCQTMEELYTLVELQPVPSIFFKGCLELDGSNMVSILAFDSRSMKHLLDD